jgi:hypothetical protein
MTRITFHKARALLLATFALTALGAHAQFGNLLQQLQKMQPPSGQQAPGGAPAFGGMGATPKGGLMPSDQWCSQQVGVLKGMKIDTGLIATEFKVPELEALQDLFMAALRNDKISKTFPSARFFQASFETKKVRAIYDTFLAFPEPDMLAALIQISRASDQQEKADALAALAFLQLQAPNLSVSSNRWYENLQGALRTEHFTSLVFKARMSAYGEYGPKNLPQALGDLVSAGSLPSKYKSADPVTKEFDTQNYQLIHTATAKDIFYNEPNMPSRQMWEGPAKMGQQIEQAQLAFAQKLPNMRIGKMYAQANQLNSESIQIGNDIIKTTQGGNQLAGQLASLESLKSNAKGEKPIFEDSSPEIQQAQLKMASKTASFDPRQKQMLAQAQEKRLAAQGVIAQSTGELLQILTSSFGDFVKMTAPLPALQQANNALIQSCIISEKWEQAMRAKGVPQADKKKAESVVSDLNSKYGKDD